MCESTGRSHVPQGMDKPPNTMEAEPLSDPDQIISRSKLPKDVEIQKLVNFLLEQDFPSQIVMLDYWNPEFLNRTNLLRSREEVEDCCDCSGRKAVEEGLIQDTMDHVSVRVFSSSCREIIELLKTHMGDRTDRSGSDLDCPCDCCSCETDTRHFRVHNDLANLLKNTGPFTFPIYSDQFKDWRDPKILQDQDLARKAALSILTVRGHCVLVVRELPTVGQELELSFADQETDFTCCSYRYAKKPGTQEVTVKFLGRCFRMLVPSISLAEARLNLQLYDSVWVDSLSVNALFCLCPMQILCTRVLHDMGVAYQLAGCVPYPTRSADDEYYDRMWMFQEYVLCSVQSTCTCVDKGGLCLSCGQGSKIQDHRSKFGMNHPSDSVQNMTDTASLISVVQRAAALRMSNSDRKDGIEATCSVLSKCKILDPVHAIAKRSQELRQLGKLTTDLSILSTMLGVMNVDRRRATLWNTGIRTPCWERRRHADASALCEMIR
mmetsp:Transcript_21072/g.33036  ORF Transcript_21072/g.33036 Transcript_21072/m.33036 type:complete len:493 (-) Transcript_21072:829-2307(-)